MAELARMCAESGDSDAARRIVLEVAARQDAPPWFLRKAAHLLAADGRFPEAMAMILREK
jgi:FimV-like protein